MNIAEMIDDMFVKSILSEIKERLFKPQDTNSVLYVIAYELGVQADLEIILEECKNIIVDLLQNTETNDIVENESIINLLGMYIILILNSGAIFEGVEVDHEKINNDLVNALFED